MKKLFLVLFFLLTVSLCFSAIINVPDDYSSIQAGIDASADGDTILVSQGVYTYDSPIILNSPDVIIQGLGEPEDVTIDFIDEGYFDIVESTSFMNMTIQSQANYAIDSEIDCSLQNTILNSCLRCLNSSLFLYESQVNGSIYCEYTGEYVNEYYDLVVYDSEINNYIVREYPEGSNNYTNHKTLDIDIANSSFTIFSDQYLPYNEHWAQPNQINLNVMGSTFINEFYVHCLTVNSENKISGCIFENCQVYVVKEDDSGGESSKYQLNNSTFYNSSFTTDCGWGSEFSNLIFWPEFDGTMAYSSADITYSLNSPIVGIGNITGNPYFKDPENGDFSLHPISPCIDAGDISMIDPDSTRADMGAIFYDQTIPHNPEILSIVDVPDDQGGNLRISWSRSDNDYQYGDITHYGIWRLWEGETMDAIGQIPAIQSETYQFVANTLHDSIPGNPNIETFVISAHTSDAWVFWFSDPMSGYSIDNIAPEVPEGLLGNEIDQSVVLNWGSCPDEDFQYYAIYRSEESGNYGDEPYAYTTVNSFIDVIDCAEVYYVVTAFDDNGNESGISEEEHLILTSYHPLVYGDIDDDGTICSYDVSLILMLLVDLDPLPEDPIPWENWRMQRADVDLDEAVHAVDAAYILQYVVGLRDSLPVFDPYRSNGDEVLITNDQDKIYFSISNPVYALNMDITSSSLIIEPAIPANEDCLSQSNNSSFAMVNAEGISGNILSIPYQRISNQQSTIDIEIEINGFLSQITYELTDQAPQQTGFSSIYPNPFNPQTTIDYALSEDTKVIIDIYNVKGQKVESLLNEHKTAGAYSIPWNAEHHNSGIYFLKITAGPHSTVRKAVLLK